MREISTNLEVGLLKNPLIALLFIIGIGYIIIKYVPTIIKIINIEIKRAKKKKK